MRETCGRIYQHTISCRSTHTEDLDTRLGRLEGQIRNIRRVVAEDTSASLTRVSLSAPPQGSRHDQASARE